MDPSRPRPYGFAASKGLSLTEYSLLLAAIGVVAIGALHALRDSTAGLITRTDQAMAPRSTLNLLTVKLSGQPAPVAAGKGYYSTTTDENGQSALTVTENSNGFGTNVSSIDGNLLNTLGSVKIADTLADLADQEQNPEVKTYLAKMAKASYYMGAAEGELDNIPGLTQNGYTKGDALSDIYKHQQQLKALMANPPQEMNRNQYNEVVPLAADVSNIGQQYLEAMEQFLDSNGNVSANFGDPSQCSLGGCLVGNGQPGSAIENADRLVKNPRGAVQLSNKTYEQYMSYNKLQKTTDNLLTQNRISSEPVRATMNSAKRIKSRSKKA